MIALMVDGSPFTGGGVGVAMVDETGKEVRCLDRPGGFGQVGEPLPIVANEELVFTTFAEIPPEEAAGMNLDFGLATLSPDDNGCATAWDSSTGTTWGSEVVTSTGEHIVVAGLTRIVSTDVDTCEARWSRSVEDLWSGAGQATFVRRLFTPTAGALIAAVHEHPTDKSRLYSLDDCGDAVAEARVAHSVDGVFRASQGWLVSTSSADVEPQGRLHYFAGSLEGEGEMLPIRCRHVVETENGLFACLRSGGNSIFVDYFTPEDGTVTESREVAQKDGARSLNGRFLLALDGAVAAGVQRTLVGGTNLELVVVAPEVEPDVVVFQELTTSVGYPPVVLPGGLIVVAVNGALHGVRTGYSGLARSTYPRGALGGNENRGFVATD